MNWILKSIVFLALGVLIVYCAWLGYLVYARSQGNEYTIQLTASFNAAALVNGEETYTDPDRAVISTYEGRQYVILPDNYKAIVSLLRKDHAMPMFRRVGKNAPLSITICGRTRLQIAPDKGSVDGALISLHTDGGKHFTMHVRGGNLWLQILEYTTAGRTHYRNLPLQAQRLYNVMA